MSPSTSASPNDAPLRIELELVRAEQADDAFAFRFARQTYLIRGRQGAYETAELPWSRELLRDLEEIRRPDRDPATVARMGDMLRELLGAAGWAGHEAAIVDARAARRRVHLTIRSAAAELYALPWELLTLRADGQHLGALGHVLLRYAWPGTSTVTERAGAGTGRVLLAWSAAGGGVPAAEQTAAIEAAARAAGRNDAIQVLPHASYGAIADALDAALAAGRPFAALHLLCHGAEVGSTFGLSLDAEGDDGRPAVVDAGRLQQLLAPYADGLRLVVVSACDGGNMGEPGNRIGSVAQRLHRAGLQYVIASRYPLSAKGSTRMAGALYQALLEGQAVERAFVEARTAASREVAQLDWASLQLYARPEDGDAGCVLAAAAAAPVVDSEAVTAVEPVPVIPPQRVVSTPMPAVESSPAPPRRSWVLPAVLGVAAVAGLAVFLVSRDDAARDATKLAIAPSEPQRAPEPEPVPEPDPGPKPDPSTGPELTSTSDTGSETTGGPPETTSATEPATPPERTPEQPKPPAAAQPIPQCSSGIKEQLRDRLGSPDGGVYKVKVRARGDGKLSILECTECGAQAERATQRAAGAKIRSYTAEDVLPCKTTVTWQ